MQSSTILRYFANVAP